MYNTKLTLTRFVPAGTGMLKCREGVTFQASLGVDAVCSVVCFVLSHVSVYRRL